MTDEQAQFLVENIDRIATALETLVTAATAQASRSVEEQIVEAIETMKRVHPVFGAAFEQMQVGISPGGKPDGSAGS